MFLFGRTSALVRKASGRDSQSLISVAAKQPPKNVKVLAILRLRRKGEGLLKEGSENPSRIWQISKSGNRVWGTVREKQYSRVGEAFLSGYFYMKYEEYTCCIRKNMLG